jgi:enoyl-CoA hydratase/carnithine racemase
MAAVHTQREDGCCASFVQQITAIPQKAVAATKQLISEAHNRDLIAHLDHAAAIARCAATPSSRDLVNIFASRR